MTNEIPAGLDRLTPAWLTEALADAFPGTTFTEATPDGVLYGSAAKARVKVSSSPAGGVPGSFVVKGSFTEGLGDDDLAQQWHELMVMMNQTEGRFYTEEAAVMGDRAPSCYYAAADDDSSIIVLEDLESRAGGVRFGVFDEPLGADDMAGVLDVLAILHSSRWDDRRLGGAPLRDSFREGGMLEGFLSQANWDQQMARARGKRVPPELTDHAHTTAAIRRAWDAKRSGPQCLIHGDPHIGNHFFDAGGAGLLDWQLFTSGHWASDVIYAIASAMEIEDRRTHEQDLVRHYLEHVDTLTGGAAPAFEDAWHDCRKFAVWGVAALLTPGEGIQAEEYNATVGERHARAAVDLDSIAMLDADGR